MIVNNIDGVEELTKGKKVFLFDFDGVIAHTEKLQWEAYNIVLKKHDVEISKERWLTYIGTSEREIYKMIKQHYDIEFDEEEKLEERLNVYLKLVREKELKPFPAFQQLLNKYPQMKYYILTSNRKVVVKDMLEYWGILDKFEQIISAATGEITKKDVLTNMKKYLKVDEPDVIYFEDMERNLKIAKELGISTIGVEHEFNRGQLTSADSVISGDLEEKS